MPSVSSSLGLDRALWARRLSLNERMLLHYVRKHIRSGKTWPRFAEPRDLIQETFLEAWRTRGSFDGDEADVFRWLIGIAHHVVTDLERSLRSKKRGFGRVVRLEGNEKAIRNPYSREGTADRMLEEKETATFVRESLRTLSHLEYQMVALVMVGRKTVSQAAEILREPVSRVQWILRSARRKLQREFARHAVIDRRGA
jgi:RNA polymerase sigma-70 factor, ECF subfamily